MPHIQQLNSHVSDLIAAGEVVERPASVVKELVENAIDAEASAVVVEIRRGGMSLIRVSDNGCGIAPQEIPTAFLRHATSKLHTASDLGNIKTLGFRGEALAAISAVSRLDILSRERGAASGASLHLEGGVPGEVRPAGAPIGTTLRVCDLFYNTPARLKFVKKDSAETAAVNGLMQHLSLSHPDISFKFIKDGMEVLHTPGDGELESAIYAALGRDFAKTLLPVEGYGGEVGVKGFVTKPLFGRGSRGMQIYFVNGRFIKSQLLAAALEESYRNQIMKGRFPGCVLEITLPATSVDVNVHPAKTNVKFVKEHDVFDAVYHTVMDALDASGTPSPPVKEEKRTISLPKKDFFQSMDAGTFREKMAGPADWHGTTRTSPGRKPIEWNTEWQSSAKVSDYRPETPSYQTNRPISPDQRVLDEKEPVGRETAPQESAGEQTILPKKVGTPAIPEMCRDKRDLPGQETLGAGAEAPWRIVGELLHTYIVCETENEEIYLIDKHAAHERINFDRLEKAQTPPMRQQLLKPIPAELRREDAALLLDNLPLLENLGFLCEDFGGDTVLIREVPADIDAGDAVPTLEELAAKLRIGRNPQEKREALLHTMSCKAAIKAGMHSDERELRALVDKVQSGEIKYCPHGRPVAVKITKYELEKIFKRA